MQINGQYQTNINTYANAAKADTPGPIANIKNPGEVNSSATIGDVNLDKAILASKIASRYDTFDITPREILKLSDELHSADLISDLEHRMLTRMPNVSLGFESAEDPDMAFEWKDKKGNSVSYWQKSLDLTDQEVDPVQYGKTENIVNILENLATLQ